MKKTRKPTRRQYDALMCICQGMSMKETALALSTTEKGVSNRIYHMIDAMFMTSKTDLMKLAKSKNWIEYKIKPYDEIEPIPIKDLMRGDF